MSVVTWNQATLQVGVWRRKTESHDKDWTMYRGEKDSMTNAARFFT